MCLLFPCPLSHSLHLPRWSCATSRSLSGEENRNGTHCSLGDRLCTVALATLADKLWCVLCRPLGLCCKYECSLLAAECLRILGMKCFAQGHVREGEIRPATSMSTKTIQETLDLKLIVSSLQFMGLLLQTLIHTSWFCHYTKQYLQKHQTSPPMSFFKTSPMSRETTRRAWNRRNIDPSRTWLTCLIARDIPILRQTLMSVGHSPNFPVQLKRNILDKS